MVIGGDFKIQINSSGVMYVMNVRTFLVGYRLYLAQVIYEKTNDENANAKRFFDSFELINVKQ